MPPDSDSPYDAVVYDLDGTVLRLEVDWESCEQDLKTLIEDVDGTATALDAWELLSTAEDLGRGDDAAAIIADYERAGATDATRLEVADELATRSGPIGVCSLNCEAACRIALAKFDLLDVVDALVGRDSHPSRKPDPGPLLAVVDELGVAPERTLFVGDSDSDRVTAERAGTAFKPVSSGHTNRSQRR